MFQKFKLPKVKFHLATLIIFLLYILKIIKILYGRNFKL